MPSQRLLEEMGKFNDQLLKAGVMLSGEGLHPSKKGKRVTSAGGKITVTDGPFTETKELICGFWMWKVKSLEEAAEWAKRIPDPDNTGGSVEIRQIFEIEDFNAQGPN
jgi:hypothetical protein